MRGISRRELARRLGISEGMVRKHVSAGVLEGAIYADGSLDADKASDAIAAVATKGKRAPAFLITARTRRLRAQVRKAYDQVMEMRATLVPVDSAIAITTSQVDYITPFLERMAQRAAKVAAGKPEREALDAIRNALFDSLEDMQKSDPPPPHDDDDSAPEVEPDFDRMTPVTLTAARTDYQAELMELERLVARGDVVHIEDVSMKSNEALGIFRSLVLAMPGRVSAYMGGATPKVARRLIWDEVRPALVALRQALETV